MPDDLARRIAEVLTRDGPDDTGPLPPGTLLPSMSLIAAAEIIRAELAPLLAAVDAVLENEMPAMFGGWREVRNESLAALRAAREARP